MSARGRILMPILLALAAWLAPAAAAGPATFVVVEARGVDLRPGAAIDGSQPLKLAEGQQLVLISTTGKTLKLRGPFDAAPAAEAGAGSADVAGAIKSLIAAKGARNDVVGLVRGAKEEEIPPNPWLVDVSHSGNRCVRGGEPVRFWHRGGAAGAITIAPYDRSWQLRTEWPAGADQLAAPSTVPLLDRATYIVRLGGNEAAVTLIAIPPSIDNDAMRIGWMTGEGCEAQAQALLRSLK